MSENDIAGNGRETKCSRLAIISFVLGFGMCLMWCPLGIILGLNPLILVELLAMPLFLLPHTVGVVLGAVALRQIKKSGKSLSGKGLAISGLVLCALLLSLQIWGFVNAVRYYCRSQVITIDDAREGLMVRLTTEGGREFIYEYNIFITGSIDGSATVNVGLQSFRYHWSDDLKIIEGEVRLEFREDFDALTDPVWLKYEPVDVRSGSLKVRYHIDPPSMMKKTTNKGDR